jgi:hypothetical protein
MLWKIARYIQTILKAFEAQADANSSSVKYNQGTEFWTSCDKSLEDIVSDLKEPFGLEDADIDAENVYEWTEVHTSFNFALNISRKHGDPINEATNPTRFMIKGHLPDEQELGLALAYCLKTDFYVGRVDYLGDDNFAFHPRRHFTFEQASTLISHQS